MNVLAETFWIQKRGCAPEEYEDAAYPLERSEYEQTCVRLAVADGATESLFARRWADQLVFAAGNGDLSRSNFSNGISLLRAAWLEWLTGKTLPWFTEEKARQGAFAAFVTLELTDENAREAPEGCWHAIGVGDSCVFHIRGENVLVRFPLTSPEAFDSRPYLLSSIGGDSEQRNEETSSGIWRRGDLFYLMTDALACWYLKHIEVGGSPTVFQGNYASVDGTQSFHSWVELLRDQGSIRNDDCTLIRVEMR